MFCPILFTQKILQRLQEKKDLRGSLFFLTLYQTKKNFFDRTTLDDCL